MSNTHNTPNSKPSAFSSVYGSPEVRDLRTENRTLTSKMHTIQSELQREKMKTLEMRKERLEMQRKCDAIDKERIAFKVKYEQEASSRRKSISTLENELKVIKSKATIGKKGDSGSSDMERAKRRMGELGQSLETAQRENQDLRRTIEQAHRENDELRKENEELKTVNASQDEVFAICSELVAKVEQIEKEKQEMKVELDNNQSRLIESIFARSEDADKFERERDELENKIKEEKEASERKLTDAMAFARKEKEEFQTKMKIMGQNFSALKKQLQETIESAEKQKETLNATSDYRELKREKLKYQEAAETLADQVEEADKEYKKLSATHNLMKNLYKKMTTDFIELKKERNKLQQWEQSEGAVRHYLGIYQQRHAVLVRQLREQTARFEQYGMQYPPQMN